LPEVATKTREKKELSAERSRRKKKKIWEGRNKRVCQIEQESAQDTATERKGQPQHHLLAKKPIVKAEREKRKAGLVQYDVTIQKSGEIFLARRQGR